MAIDRTPSRVHDRSPAKGTDEGKSSLESRSVVNAVHDGALGARRPRWGMRLTPMEGIGNVRYHIITYAVPIVLMLLIVVFAALKPVTFFAVGNFQSILSGQAVLLVVALTLTVVLSAGDLDLSVGGAIGFGAVFIGYLTSTAGLNWILAVITCLGAGLLIGIVNATLVVRLKTNSFIITLAMGTLLDGIASAVSNSQDIGGFPSEFLRVANADVLGISLSFWYALGIGVIVWYVVTQTVTGRFLYFTGEGREAARLAGIRVGRVRTGAFVVSAIGATLGGLFLAGQTGSVQSGIGDPFILPAYAAVFLGAATIKLGRFNPVGTFIAVLVLAVGTDGLQLFGLANWVTDVFDAGVLIVAVVTAVFAGVKPTSVRG